MAEISRPGGFRTLFYVVLFVAVGFLWLRSSTVRFAAPDRAPLASALPMRDLSGAAVDLQDYAGRAVVVNVWASWCGPCRSEIPAFGRVYDDYREAGLEILGLNVDDMAREDVARVSRELGIGYPVMTMAGGLEGSFHEPGVIPHSWFIDRRGRLRGSHSGVLSESALRHAVKRLLDD